MSKITIVGLGPGDYNLISQGALESIKNKENVYFRTVKHPIVHQFDDSIKYQGLDYFYESEDDFEKVYESISNFIIEKAKDNNIVYAVPGHPRVAENTVSIIEGKAKENNIELEIIPSMSFVDAMFNYIGVDPVHGFSLIDALEIKNSYIDTKNSTIITQVYDRLIASNVKLSLMEYYSDEQEVCIIRAAGVKNVEKKTFVKLYELDRSENNFDYLTSLYIAKSNEKIYNNVSDLENIVSRLRAPNGCPWDAEQTHHSLKKHIIEEAYELAQAIDNDDIDEMIEELGDILLHVVFHAEIGQEEGYFDLKEIIASICNKLVYRHPHVFGEAKYEKDEYDKTWEALKKKEKGEKTVTESLKRIPKYLPALTKAHKVQHKAALVGFDWDNIEDVYKKIQEEYKELLDECKLGNIQYIQEELGDLIFSIVNLARFLDLDPEEALNKTTQKFINRFSFIEDTALKSDIQLENMTLEEMDKLWNEAKLKK